MRWRCDRLAPGRVGHTCFAAHRQASRADDVVRAPPGASELRNCVALLPEWANCIPRKQISTARSQGSYANSATCTVDSRRWRASTMPGGGSAGRSPYPAARHVLPQGCCLSCATDCCSFMSTSPRIRRLNGQPNRSSRPFLATTSHDSSFATKTRSTASSFANGSSAWVSSKL